MRVRADSTMALWFEPPPRPGEFAVRLGEVAYAFYNPRRAEVGPLPWVSSAEEETPQLAHVRTLAAGARVSRFGSGRATPTC